MAKGEKRVRFGGYHPAVTGYRESNMPTRGAPVVTTAKWAKHAGARVIRFEKERTARSGLWRVPLDARHDNVGVELMQNDDGCLYLTRTSRDGFVQGWRLLGSNGKPLRLARKYRPPCRP